MTATTAHNAASVYVAAVLYIFQCTATIVSKQLIILPAYYDVSVFPVFPLQLLSV